MRIRVSNRGGETVHGLAVRVIANRPIVGGEVHATEVIEALFAAGPTLRPAGQDGLDLLLPDLRAGASRSYDLDLQEIAEPSAARHAGA